MKGPAIVLFAGVFALGMAWAAGEAGKAASSYEMQFDRNEVRKIQETLNDIGFDAGPVDGIMGSKTRDALRNFQASRGLDASGEVNQPTILALGLRPAEFAAFREQPKAQDLDSRSIRQIQAALNGEGFDAGPVDGVWGEQSRRALRDFQLTTGLETTGELDRETLLGLGFSLSEFAAGEFAEEPAQSAPSAR